MTRRFLDFSKASPLSSIEKEKVYPGPGLDNLPAQGALPEEDRWSGPMTHLPGGDAGRGPGRFFKDVSEFDVGVGIGGPSKFRPTQNYIPPRGVPR